MAAKTPKSPAPKSAKGAKPKARKSSPASAASRRGTAGKHPIPGAKSQGTFKPKSTGAKLPEDPNLPIEIPIPEPPPPKRGMQPYRTQDARIHITDYNNMVSSVTFSPNKGWEIRISKTNRSKHFQERACAINIQVFFVSGGDVTLAEEVLIWG